MNFLPPELEAYIETHSTEESDVLKKLNRETNSNVMMPRMLSGHLQGRTLAMLSNMIQPMHILEIGTYTGYSAICLAEGLQKDGKLYTIDINEELETMINNYFKEAKLDSKIELLIGNALNLIPNLNIAFDLVFIDADKENYSTYYDLAFQKLKIGGYIIADNVLWSGKVIEKRDKDDKDTKAIKDFNQKVQHDNRVENVLMPIRDGLMVIRKKSD